MSLDNSKCRLAMWQLNLWLSNQSEIWQLDLWPDYSKFHLTTQSATWQHKVWSESSKCHLKTQCHWFLNVSPDNSKCHLTTQSVTWQLKVSSDNSKCHLTTQSVTWQRSPLGQMWLELQVDDLIYILCMTVCWCVVSTVEAYVFRQQHFLLAKVVSSWFMLLQAKIY